MESKTIRISKGKYFGCNKKKAYLFTYPHCDVDKKRLLEMFVGHWLLTGKLEYAVACEEKHKDGRPHNHVVIILKEATAFKRAEVEKAFDLVKEYALIAEPDGDVEEEWDWWIPWCRKECGDEELKAGQEWIQTEPLKWVARESEEGMKAILEGKTCAMRRFHCNVLNGGRKEGMIEYVKKGGKFEEWGEIERKGQMSVIKRKSMNELIMNGDILELVKDGEISIYNYERLKKIQQMIKNERNAAEAKERAFKLKIVCCY